MGKPKPRPKKIVTEWLGFPERLGLAVKQRMRETGVSQNTIADEVGVESGQFSKILSGERATGLTVNTLLLLASALDVNPMWLMTGREPSGLSKVEAPAAQPARRLAAK